MIQNKIKVLIVDDSALIRQFLKETLSAEPDLEVVAAVPDPLFAIERIKRLKPDVISLDVEMPRMTGLEFLKTLYKENPIPVVMISSLTKSNCEITMKCLEAGAVDFVTKPSNSSMLSTVAEEIITKIKAAANAKIFRSGDRLHLNRNNNLSPALSNLSVSSKNDSNIIIKRTKRPATAKGEPIIAIGASTGGVTALFDIFKELPLGLPGIIVSQHMPAGFTKAFADRINNNCQIAVKEAENGDRVKPSTILLAPGNYHLLLQRDYQGYYVSLNEGPLVNRHRPSVDVMFRSVANTAGPNALGIILTGMGNDGAGGMLEMKEAGSFNVAQDEASCVVFGMPKSAIENKSVDQVLSLTRISSFIINYFNHLY